MLEDLAEGLILPVVRVLTAKLPGEPGWGFGIVVVLRIGLGAGRLDEIVDNGVIDILGMESAFGLVADDVSHLARQIGELGDAFLDILDGAPVVGVLMVLSAPGAGPTAMLIAGLIGIAGAGAAFGGESELAGEIVEEGFLKGVDSHEDTPDTGDGETDTRW
jgi:hypothetical protein